MIWNYVLIRELLMKVDEVTLEGLQGESDLSVH